MKLRLSIWIIMLLFTSRSDAIVRQVKSDDTQMESVYTSLGKATILDLENEPESILLGNSNYFQIATNGTDVSIQPIGRATTNLFVYTSRYRYGFVLYVDKGKHDDVIKVKTISTVERQTKEAWYRTLELRVKSVSRWKNLNLVDCVLVNKSGKSFDLNESNFEISSEHSKLIAVAYSGNKIQDGSTNSVRLVIKGPLSSVSIRAVLGGSVLIKPLNGGSL